MAIATRQSLVLVKLADGKQAWSYPWKTSYDVNAADPIVAGDKIFISSGYNHGGALLKVTAQGAEKVWENKNMRNHFNSCVLWQGTSTAPTTAGCAAWPSTPGRSSGPTASSAKAR